MTEHTASLRMISMKNVAMFGKRFFREEFGVDGEIHELILKLSITNQNDYKDVIELDPVKIHIG